MARRMTERRGLKHMGRHVGAGRLMYAAWVAGGLAVAVPAAAQTAPHAAKADPSPFAPGDLKQPIFDTTTPVYNVGDVKDKAAKQMVAEVDGRVITLGNVADAIKGLPPVEQRQPFPLLFAQIRSQLIRQQALVIRAHQAGVDEDPAIVRKISETSTKILADAYLRHELLAKITEQDLLARYDRDIAGKPGPEQVHLRLIMVGTKDEAQAAITQLKSGTDFSALAKQISKDTTASVGGDLGWVERRGVNAEIGAAAFSLPAGQVTPYPVSSVGAWFVLKVDDRRQQPTPSFASVRGELTEAVVRDRVPAVIQQAITGLTVRVYDISGKENVGAEEGAPGND